MCLFWHLCVSDILVEVFSWFLLIKVKPQFWIVLKDKKDKMAEMEDEGGSKAGTEIGDDKTTKSSSEANINDDDSAENLKQKLKLLESEFNSKRKRFKEMFLQKEEELSRVQAEQETTKAELSLLKKQLDDNKAELELVKRELGEAKSETAVAQILQENLESVERQKVKLLFFFFFF